MRKREKRQKTSCSLPYPTNSLRDGPSGHIEQKEEKWPPGGTDRVVYYSYYA